MILLSVLGVLCIVFAILILIGQVPGGIVAAVILAVIGLALVGNGGVFTGRRP